MLLNHTRLYVWLVRIFISFILIQSEKNHSKSAIGKYNLIEVSGRFQKKMKFFLKTDLQQTQNGFQMWFLCQNMCLVNVEIAGKFQVNICIRYKFIAL